MKLGTKLFAPQVVVLTLILVATALQTSLRRSERQSLERATAQLEKVAGQIQRLNQVFADLEREVLTHAQRPERVQTSRLYELQLEASTLVKRVAETDWTPRGVALAEDLQQAQASLARAQLQYVDQQDPAKSRQSFVRWWFVAQRANAMLADLSAYNMRRLNRSLNEVGTARRGLGNAILGLTLTASLLALLFVLWGVRRVLRPIAQLIAASERVGEPGQEIPRLEGRNDELGTLATSLSNTTQRLTRSKVELEDALQARDVFLSIAAHELKTPMTSLRLQLELLKRKLQGVPDEGLIRRSANSLDRQVLRIRELVDELLDVTRIQAGKLELHREVVRLAPEVEEVAARCEELLKQAGCTLTLALDPKVSANIDASRFEQLLVNLLGNAAKYAPGAPVNVSLVRDRERAVIRVRDHGPGIAPDMRPLLFQRFARHTGATAPGLGLGLFISQQIAVALGGTLSAGNAEGQGAEFVLELPAV